MSELLRLRGNLEAGDFKSPPIKKALYQKQPMEIEHVRCLLNELLEIKKRYSEVTFTSYILVSVAYVGVVPKSRRIGFLFGSARRESDAHIVGARFENDPNGARRHVMTYRLTKSEFDSSVASVRTVVDAFADYKYITNEDLEAIDKLGRTPFKTTMLSGSKMASLLKDLSNVDSFQYPCASGEDKESQLITIYDIEDDFETVLKKLGIEYAVGDVYDKHSIRLNNNSIEQLRAKAGFLIAMETRSQFDLQKDLFGDSVKSGKSRAIQNPGNEPTIGVIDTFFNDDVYFSEWVKTDSSFTSLEPTLEDKVHATEVCSIIVDGPALNPDLDDDCGHFKVAHFPVAINGRNSWITIGKAIKAIVTRHEEIHVWNLSLGSVEAVSENCASPIGALLDELQAEHPNLLFVVASTNMKDGKPESKRIGSPADSINALVVGSCTRDLTPTEYSRHGPALTFYRKPDLSFFGGDGFDDEKDINVAYAFNSEKRCSGTSFAAPWVARKACFLIDVMGFSRDEAKALLIDAAIKNGRGAGNESYLGYGVLPISIFDVVNPRADEIKFIIRAKCQSYYTYTYNIPVPSIPEGFPFKARAVLSASLHCDRNKGVDYSNEEIGIAFGRMKEGKIKTINGDPQEDCSGFATEDASRQLFRKWDNIKVVEETLKKRRVPAKKYSDFWGLRITSKIRNNQFGRPQTNVAIVVTLTEIYGQDRAEKFISLCLSRGWLVDRITIENQLKLQEEASATIEWDTK